MAPKGYEKKCEEMGRHALSLSSYTSKLNQMIISFAKLGHEECERCIIYNEHSCVTDEIQSECVDSGDAKKDIHVSVLQEENNGTEGAKGPEEIAQPAAWLKHVFVVTNTLSCSLNKLTSGQSAKYVAPTMST